MAKKKEQQKVRCMECCIGVFTQWDNNPVIVNCRNLETKDVASTMRTCQYYKPGPNKVRKLTHFR